MHRVVISGMGVLAPNGHGLTAFERSLREGQSGIQFISKLKELCFSCQVAGIPQGVDEAAERYFSPYLLSLMNGHTVYAAIAAIDCWRDAGFEVPDPKSDTVDEETGAIIGNGMGPLDIVGETLIPFTDSGKVRQLGSSIAERTMCSSAASRVAGILGLGGEVSMNSSACATGTQAIVEGWSKIRSGQVSRILVGAAEGPSHYNWAPFDSMRVLSSKYNHAPEQASRPMSASYNGFVPAAGAGMLMMESLDSALARSAKIHAEVLGGFSNCGGHRRGGSMTLPSAPAAQACIRMAMRRANVESSEIDAINGHLTGTSADVLEVANWQAALKIDANRFPLLNSTLSLTGHSLAASGAISSIASVLQLQSGFVHGSRNCEDLHPKLEQFSDSIPHATVYRPLRTLAKASFGFGDVNACVIFRRWQHEHEIDRKTLQ